MPLGSALKYLLILHPVRLNDRSDKRFTYKYCRLGCNLTVQTSLFLTALTVEACFLVDKLWYRPAPTHIYTLLLDL